MTVTMTIEEFDELREAHRTLTLVKNLLRENVTYYPEVYDEGNDALVQDYALYARVLDSCTVAQLVKATGLYFNYGNIVRDEENEA